MQRSDRLRILKCRFVRDHVRTVPGNTTAKFAVHSVNRVTIVEQSFLANFVSYICAKCYLSRCSFQIVSMIVIGVKFL